MTAPKAKAKAKTVKRGVGQGVGGGRPRFVIDHALAEKLAAIQATQEEIASVLGCSVDTLLRDKKFCEIHKAGINKGRMSLRRLQWAAANKGNTTMLVWLGKQYLHQRDTPTLVVQDGPNNGDNAIEQLAALIDAAQRAK